VSLTCHIIDVEWCMKSLVFTTQELPSEHTSGDLAAALTD